MKNLARFFGINSSQTVAEDKVEQIEPILPAKEDTTVDTNNIKMVLIDEIIPNPFQPRKTFKPEALQELASSIAEYGVIQPLLVRQINGQYELIAGERRLRASKLAGQDNVPIIIKELSDKEMAELAMIENLQREDLHFFEEAEGFQQLIANFSFTQEELAKRMGRKQSTIANKMRLLKLGPEARKQLFDANLTERHARALLKIEDEKNQLELIDIIKDKSLNVRDTELLVEEILAEKVTQPKANKNKRVSVIRDVRIFLNSINEIAGQMKKSGMKVKIKQEQDDEFITIKMVIPKQKK